MSTLVGATSNVAAVAQNPLYRNLGPCIKGGLISAGIVAPAISMSGDPAETSAIQTQLNIDKATAEVKELQDSILQDISGIEDNAKYQEYERKKMEVLINMQNQTAKLQDTILQVTAIYNIVGAAVG